MLEFNLLEGEEILKEIKPLHALRSIIFIRQFGIFLLVYFIIFAYVLVLLMPPLGYDLQVWLFTLFIIVLILSIVTSFILSLISYDKYYYWITNKRVIVKSGIIGYKISSIPYERISDIVISRSILERLFGVTSLHIQSLAGQLTPSPYSKMGSEGNLLAVYNARELQSMIWELVKKKRKEEGLTF